MSVFDKLVAASLPLVPRALVRRFSRRYIAGEDRQAALRIGRRLQKAGYRITYDVLGESVMSEAEVRTAVDEYHHLRAELHTAELECNLSLKPTQMGLLFREDLCFEMVSEVLDRLRSEADFVRFEMEDSPTLEATLRVFARLRENHGQRVGCVLQSRIRRAEQDARDLVARPQPLNVRLVKGVYVEPPEVAFQDPEEVRDNFKRILRVLLEGGAFVGVATHDPPLIQDLIALLQEQPEFAARCEIQMLLGVQEELRRKTRDAGIPVRAYIPYGKDWYPYVTRRLRENPQLARHALIGMFKKREVLAD